jgi:hypothetical protein
MRYLYVFNYNVGEIIKIKIEDFDLSGYNKNDSIDYESFLKDYGFDNFAYMLSNMNYNVGFI